MRRHILSKGCRAISSIAVATISILSSWSAVAQQYRHDQRLYYHDGWVIIILLRVCTKKLFRLAIDFQLKAFHEIQIFSPFKQRLTRRIPSTLHCGHCRCDCHSKLA